MIVSRANKFHFLSGGGELGELTRSFDWSKTSVGAVDTWPHSLRTIVSVILRSEFPMFLWWGEDLIQFYNDAYRPSLGNEGKHPVALGQRAEECWPETWDMIQPLINKVRTDGSSFFSQDQLVPIFRNGKLEDVYWTFSYSPVIDEEEQVAGVLVTCTETTEKVVNYQALLESNDQLQFAIEATELGTWDYDPVRDKFSGNARLKTWFGGDPAKEMLLSQAIEAIAEKDRDRVTQAIQTALDISSDGKYDIEYTIIPATTKVERIVRARGRVWFNENKSAYRFNGTLQDITASVKARKRIEQSESQFRSLIAAAPIGIALFVGRDLIVDTTNQAFLDIIRKDPDIKGKPLAKAMPELEGQPFLQILDDVYTTGKPFHTYGTKVNIMHNGKMTHGFFDFSYTPLFDTEGNVFAILDISDDVTEQVLFQKRLAVSEENLRNIILQAPVAMCILKGKSLEVEIANEKILEIWGKNYDDVVGKPLFDGLPEARSQGLEMILENVLTTGERFIAHERPVTLPKNGKLEQKYLNFVYEAFRQSDGGIQGIMAIAIEVTEQVIARQKIEEIVHARTQELADSNESLQRSNEELAQFAYIASHDLQEPARKIKTFSEMLRKNLHGLDPRSETYLNKIEVSSARMLTLIRDVLTFSQLSKVKDEFVKIDLNRILESVKEDFELLIAEKNAIIQNDSLPVIYGIPVQISQLFANLISNSLKFTAKDRIPRIEIKVSLSTDSGAQPTKEGEEAQQFYKISFIDNGIGFHQQNAMQIFDIFQRLHGKNDYQGTGIGLAMCKKICRNHNGDIFAESVAGEGATFHVLFPKEPTNNTNR